MNISSPAATANASIGFSVCVPVWNGGIWLPGLVESILGQSYRHLEIVIGDNASSEDIASLTGLSGDARVRYHRWEDHVDTYANFNRTTLLGSFDWTVPIGADDRLWPTALEDMERAIRDAESAGSRIAMVVAPARRVDPAGMPADRTYYGSQGIQRIRPGIHEAASWLMAGVGAGAPAWNIGSVAFRRDAFVASEGFRGEVGLSADMELVLRMATFGPVMYLEHPVLDYTVRRESDGSVRFAQNRAGGESPPPIASALLAALRAHQRIRTVSRSDRASLLAAVARSYLRRANQHRVLSGGLGRSGAAHDVWMALRVSPATALRPRNLSMAAAAVGAPTILIRALSTLLTRRRHS